MASIMIQAVFHRWRGYGEIDPEVTAVVNMLFQPFGILETLPVPDWNRVDQYNPTHLNR